MDTKLVGVVSGYRLSESPDTLFIWQVCTHKEMRGKGVAKQMVRALLARENLQDIRSLLTTISPSNTASKNLFLSLAEESSAKIEEVGKFDSESFGGDGHEEEIIYRIVVRKDGSET